MDKEYIISFSSFYKAAYAEDILEEYNINSTLKKLPPELIKSCGTGLYLRTDSIQRVTDIFNEREVVPRGIYYIKRNPSKNGKKYIKV